MQAAAAFTLTASAQHPLSLLVSLYCLLPFQMGIYYFGYMPSFWIRLRCLGPLTMPTLLPAVLPAGSPVFGWPIIQRLLASSADWFTWGALVQWWTMFSIVTADGTLIHTASTLSRRDSPGFLYCL